MKILGISAFYHDSAAALVVDGKIVAAAQEERFTRKRHDAAFPSEAVRYVLSEGGITAEDIDCVAFYDKPLLKFERILETYMAYAPLGIRSFIKAVPIWIKQKLWMKEIIKRELDFEGTIVFPEHHASHAASAFFPSPFESSALLTLDGVGEWTTTSYGVGRGNNISIHGDLHFPHSLGLLYSAFTYYTGFKVNSGEYKVMGLAPYGEPKYVDLIMENLIDLKDDGSFKLNMDYFDFPAGLKMTNDRFSALFGAPPRQGESEITQREMDLARSVQDVTEEVVLRIGRHIRKVTGESNLCLAGGVALNCVANGKLLEAGIFDNIWIQPSAGDAGGALGSALFAWHQYYGKERTVDGVNDLQEGSYLGPSFTDGEIEAYLKGRDIPYEVLEENKVPRRMADIIAGENVVGWFEGRMEFGPRSLGARSILGDSWSEKMQEIMNLKIKFRESFRPFAPAVLDSKASDFFKIDTRSPYMLLVAGVQEDKRREMTEEESGLFGIKKLNAVRSVIPAVTHVDYSARVQTVHEDTNPLFYSMLKALDEDHGSPVVINTSFNVRGEPIVCTPEDAYRCFMRTNMDFLIMGSILLDKRDQKALEGDTDWQQEFELD